jgi:hypothetical protein
MPFTLNPGPNRSMIHPNPTPVAGGPIRILAPQPIDPGFYKSLILDVLGVLSALALGYAYFAYLSSGLPLWFSLGAFLLFGAVSSLQVFLQKKSNRRAFVILGETSAFAIWFVYVGLWILAPVVLAMFVLLWWGYLRSRSELAYTTEIRFFRVTRHAVGKAATAVIIAMILFYLSLAGAGSLFVSESNFQPFYNWASGIFNNFYPGILMGGSFNDFAQSVVQQDLQNDPSYKAMSPAEQALAAKSAVSQFVGGFSNRLGVSITTSTQASDVFYGGIANAFHGTRDRLQGWFFVVWALVAFVILRSIGVIFSWITQFLSLIIYEILLSTGFMKVVQHPDVREEVEY